MQYPASAYLNLFFLFFGAALGSFFCILAGKIFKKKYFKFRLSLAFLLLSAAVIFAVLIMLEMQGQAQNILAVLKSRILPLLIYSVIGILCAAFLRTVFPVAAALYIAFTFWLGLTLYKQMPLPSAMTITVSQTFVRDESNGVEYKFGEQQQDALCHLAFDVYNLNPNVLLPLPNVWYKLRGTTENYSGIEPVFKQSASGFFKKILFSIGKKILGEPCVQAVEVPIQQIYPALYNVRFNTSGSKFLAVLEKIM